MPQRKRIYPRIESREKLARVPIREPETQPADPSFRPVPNDPVRDVRGDWIGCREAAGIVGIGRTQMWRIAANGKIPCVVFGTEERPEYVFDRETVVWYSRERRTHRKLREAKRLQKLFAAMAKFARTGTLGEILRKIVEDPVVA